MNLIARPLYDFPTKHCGRNHFNQKTSNTIREITPAILQINTHNKIKSKSTYTYAYNPQTIARERTHTFINRAYNFSVESGFRLESKYYGPSQNNDILKQLCAHGAHSDIRSTTISNTETCAILDRQRVFACM